MISGDQFFFAQKISFIIFGNHGCAGIKCLKMIKMNNLEAAGYYILSCAGK